MAPPRATEVSNVLAGRSPLEATGTPSVAAVASQVARADATGHLYLGTRGPLTELLGALHARVMGIRSFDNGSFPVTVVDLKR